MTDRQIREHINLVERTENQPNDNHIAMLDLYLDIQWTDMCDSLRDDVEEAFDALI